MSEQGSFSGVPRAGGAGRSGFGRRVAARRQELGLTRDEVAARAGAAVGYIRYVEEKPALPDVALLLRVAGALETTVAELCGGNADLLAARARSKPWAGGEREVWIRIEPEHITGRLIQVR